MPEHCVELPEPSGKCSEGTGWVLSVADNGVGMPTLTRVSPGLGTSIVEALAKQLGANITISNSAPGTTVLLAHPMPKTDQFQASAPDAV